MEIEKRAFASEICHSRDWKSSNEDPPSKIRVETTIVRRKKLVFFPRTIKQQKENIGCYEKLIGKIRNNESSLLKKVVTEKKK